MPLSPSRTLLATLCLTLAGFGVGSFGATADEGDGTPPRLTPAYALHPMQVLTPPMWQPHPPAWYRPDLIWRQQQPEPAAPREPDERPARSHWERHAPEWMNLPPESSRTTLWKPRPLTPAAVDSEVIPVEVPPPDDAAPH